MPDIKSVSDTKLKVSGTINFHLRMGKSRMRLNFGVVNELVVPVILRTTYIDRLVKLIYTAERRIVLTTTRWYPS